MALLLLRVLAVAVAAAAAAADDVPTVWWDGAPLACNVAGAARPAQRRPPPPPLDSDDHSRGLYSWTHDGETVPPKRISLNGTLEVSRRRDNSSEGVYQCSVLYHGGLVLGHPIHLKFASMDKQFHTHPENLTIRAGQPVALSCAIASSPPAYLAWLRNGDPLPEDPRYHVLTNQLLITDVRKEDSGFYRCMASNAYANKTKMSHRGRLQVEAWSDEEAPPSLLALHHEGNLTVARRSRVVLPCPVTGWPRPEILWQLTAPGSRTAELDAVEEVLVLPHAELDQEGLYTCRVPGTDVEKSFNVTITEPVSIVIPPTSKEDIRAKTVRFNCTASGRPEPSVTWYKDGLKLPLTGRAKVLKNAERQELVISTVTSNDAGVYQCFASNGISMASSWAFLNVTGDGAAAPSGVRCKPADARSIALSWSHPESDHVVAYTVHSIDKLSSLLPHTITEETVTVNEALKPYGFQVRAFVNGAENVNIASDMSDTVVCQSQGVPIKLTKLEENTVLVSWQKFAQETPGVLEWMLQYRGQSSSDLNNVTLPADVTNYTLTVPPSSPVFVRVLGTKVMPWLQQDLSLLSWSTTAKAREHQDNGNTYVVPSDMEIEELSAYSFTVKWQCDADAAPAHYVFIVCVRNRETLGEECQESYKNYHTVEDLEPDTEYEVRVQARDEQRGPGGAFTPPYVLRTMPVETQRFKGIKYRFVNATSVMVWWGGREGNYTVQYSSELKLPIDEWATLQLYGNRATINIDEKSNQTFVMVTGYDPQENSKILTIDHANVRVLGTKVSWGFSGLASDSDAAVVPSEVKVTELAAHSFTVTWRCDEADTLDEYFFIVCVRKSELHTEECQESNKNHLTVTDLEPDTQYEVRVQARDEQRGPGGAFTPPYVLRTMPVENQRFKDIKYRFVNATASVVYWGGKADNYTLLYNSELKLPVDTWTTVKLYGNSATINIDDKTNKTFVMVTAYDPPENSKILTIDHFNDLRNLSHQYTRNGVRVSWRGGGGGSPGQLYKVQYSQLITTPMEQWITINVTKPEVQLEGLDPSLPTYVMVTSAGPGRRGEIITIPPPPPDDSSALYLGLLVSLGVLLLVLLIIAGLCIWRRRKKSRSPLRSRRRNQSANESNGEEASEMTSVGGRLANGGAPRGAGEPLLNGHVHITENPALSKTPNGKTKKSRHYELVFDVSRYEDPNTTAETVLEPDCSPSTTLHLLDTSRGPDTIPKLVTSHNSFSKLPDDNMNSELTRSTVYIEDNSTSHPTLQPNG